MKRIGRWSMLAAALLLLAVGCWRISSPAMAEEPSAATAATAPATETTAAAGAALSVASSIDDVLDALDARGKTLKDLSADVRLDDTDNNTGDETIHLGSFILQKQANGDARVKIVFEKKQSGKKIMAQHHVYVLDGGKLIERDYDRKIEVIRQVVKPGQKVNLLKLGEGPFPLPIGQDKAEVKQQFEVKKIEPAKDDPAGTIHVQLIPREKTSLAQKFESIDLWIDPANAMPRRIQTLDKNESTIKTTDLTNVKINAGVKASDFEEPELPSGWTSHNEPYGQ